LTRQEVVQPGGEVTDLRTEVTGVTAADLEGITATRDVVRAAVLNAIRRLAATGQQVLVSPMTAYANCHYDMPASYGADRSSTSTVLPIAINKHWQVRRGSSNWVMEFI